MIPNPLARAYERNLVWVLGSPRSGSTWLWAMISHEPGIKGINEPLIGWHLGPFMCDQPTVRAEDLDLSNFTLRRQQAGRDQSFFSESYRDVWLPGLRDLLDERLYAHVARSVGHRRARETLLVLKEPHGSQSADLIMAAQPRARLLFLLRDGRDVVDSELAANLEGSWVTTAFPAAGIAPGDRLEFVVQSAYKWLWRTEVVERAFADHPGPKLLVRYEELRRDTGPQLARILEWLGRKPEPAAIDALVARHAFESIPEAERGTGHFHRSATPGSWSKNLSPEEQEAVLAILGPKLTALGYVDGDRATKTI